MFLSGGKLCRRASPFQLAFNNCLHLCVSSTAKFWTLHLPYARIGLCDELWMTSCIWERAHNVHPPKCPSTWMLTFGRICGRSTSSFFWAAYCKRWCACYGWTKICKIVIDSFAIAICTSSQGSWAELDRGGNTCSHRTEMNWMGREA